MKIIEGELIETLAENNFEVLLHCCNCFNTMPLARGVAKVIGENFPESIKADTDTVRGDIGKLGTCSRAFNRTSNLVIVNMYTQYNYGSKGNFLDEQALVSCLKLVKQTYGDKKICYPRIGVDRAGGDPVRVRNILNEQLGGCDHTLIRRIELCRK